MPGDKRYGLEHADQPVLAIDEVRYQGEPVAIVAADHPETARRAVGRIEVDYEVLRAGHRRRDGRRSTRRRRTCTRAATWCATLPIRRGDPDAATRRGAWCIGEYEVGMQDQAFLGPESGLAVPAEDGGVDLYVATQWLHVDQQQVAACLGLPPEKVRLTLAGVGGAFGGREDLSMQVHACLLALHTGKPVKMVYNREESFFGHVHRHPARLRYEHGADRDGQLVYVKATIVLDGGAYASSYAGGRRPTRPRWASARTRCRTCAIDAYGAYTNNPPCGAMRGFGAVQAVLRVRVADGQARRRARARPGRAAACATR